VSLRLIHQLFLYLKGLITCVHTNCEGRKVLVDRLEESAVSLREGCVKGRCSKQAEDNTTYACFNRELDKSCKTEEQRVSEQFILRVQH